MTIFERNFLLRIGTKSCDWIGNPDVSLYSRFQSMVDSGEVVNWTELPPEQLIFKCRDPRNREAWEEFMRRYHPGILKTATRVARTWKRALPHEVDDTVQNIYLKLCSPSGLSTLRKTSDEAIGAFVHAVSSNVAHDFFRYKFKDRRDESLTETLINIEEHIGNVDLDRQVLILNLHRLVNTEIESPRDRAIFLLYFRDGLTMQAIADLPGVGITVKGVEVVIKRLVRDLQDLVGAQQETPRQNRLNE